jgi:hypothetical protein
VNSKLNPSRYPILSASKTRRSNLAATKLQKKRRQNPKTIFMERAQREITFGGIFVSSGFGAVFKLIATGSERLPRPDQDLAFLTIRSSAGSPDAPVWATEPEPCGRRCRIRRSFDQDYHAPCHGWSLPGDQPFLP